VIESGLNVRLWNVAVSEGRDKRIGIIAVEEEQDDEDS
jgi:hypothetical protein